MFLQHKRRQFFVDSKVQGALLLRGFIYWLLCALTLFLGVLAWQCIVGPARLFYEQFGEIWFRYAPVFALLLALLPVFVLDFVQFTNRFAGPVLRLRAAMRQLARGETPPTLSFRDDDFWQDLAADFNRIAAQLKTVEAKRSTSPSREVEATDELVLTATD